ncbi:MAG TPA: hypothetical protein VNY33_05920 [Gaiellaceae bacterium]|jgi:hypothetical protein|nr:hypothetical protein [Gaiellaceae bacterium]
MELSQLVHRSARTSRPELPSAPWVPATLCCGPAAGFLGFGIAGGLTGSALLVAPISVALLGVFLALRRSVERARLRGAADEWIARGWENPAARYGWRLEELTSLRERRVLCRSLRTIARELAQRYPSVGSLLNRRAIYAHRPLLIALAERLGDLERPVSAAGVLAVRRLMTQPDSPLYARRGPDDPPRDTGAELRAILDRLEVRR